MRPRAWITGAGGLIGHYLLAGAETSAPDLEVIGLTRETLDLLDFGAVRSRFKSENPELIIHCAALSRSPDCEANPALAQKLNVDLTALLAELMTRGRFVFFSTDLVFDGKKGHYTEANTPNPLSVYASTKVAAERVLQTHPNTQVIRTSLNGGKSPTGDRGFNEQLRLAWGRGARLKLFVDEFRNPISAEFTAKAVWELALTAPCGLYHVAGAERLSRWEIGRALAERCPELEPKIEAASLSSYQGAPRSPDTSLVCDKAQRFLDFPLPRFREWLAGQPRGSF